MSRHTKDPANKENKGLGGLALHTKERRLSTATTTVTVDMEDMSSYTVDPLLNRTIEHPTSNLDTMIHLLKGFIGNGILAMPDAFRNAGLVVGLIGTMLMGVICTHCMHMLISCSHELCRRVQRSSLEFSEVTELAFQFGPQPLQKYSQIAR